MRLTGLDQVYVRTAPPIRRRVLAPALVAYQASGRLPGIRRFRGLHLSLLQAFDFEFGGRNTRTEQHSTSSRCAASARARNLTFVHGLHLRDQPDVVRRAALAHHAGRHDLRAGRDGLQPGRSRTSPLRCCRTRRLIGRIRPATTSWARAPIRSTSGSASTSTVFDIRGRTCRFSKYLHTPNGPVGLNGNSAAAPRAKVSNGIFGGVRSGLRFGLLGAYTDAKLTSDAPILAAPRGQIALRPRSEHHAQYRLHMACLWKLRGLFGRLGNHTGTRFTSFAPPRRLHRM